MSTRPVSSLRQRMIEDMNSRKLGAPVITYGLDYSGKPIGEGDAAT